MRRNKFIGLNQYEALCMTNLFNYAHPQHDHYYIQSNS